MIRWKYVAPRLTLLALVWASVTWGTDPLLRWSIILVGQQSVGARVDVSSLHTVLRKGTLQIDRIAVADPQTPLQNLLEADQTALQIDTTAFMQRKFVVSEGRISGIRFGTPRAESGVLPGAKPQPSTTSIPTVGDKLENLGEQWLGSRTQQLQSDLEQNLQSVRVANDLAERWPQSYAALEQEVQQIRQETETLIGYVQQSTDNPLRALEVCRDAATKVDALRKQSIALRENLAQLQRQMQEDKQALIMAKKHDEALIRQHANLDSLNPETISRYLLSPELAPHVATATTWIHWFRDRFPSKDVKALAPTRGQDIVFRGLSVTPDFLVRRLALDGEGTLGDRQVRFLGEATGLTTQLSCSNQPMALRLQAQGGIPAELHAKRELQADRVVDQLVINCPKFPLPARELGQKDNLALQVSDGEAHVWSQLKLIGDELQGEIILKQESVSIRTTALPASLASFHQSVDQVTSSVKNLEVLVKIDGQLNKPHLQIKSNLGPHLAQAMHSAVEQELHVRAQALLQGAQQKVEQQVANLEAKVLGDQRQLLDSLQLGDDQLKGLVNEVANRMGISQRYFSAERLLDNMLRR